MKKNKDVEPFSEMFDKLSADVETVKGNIQKRKSENTTLKVLLYTGLVVLLVGFLYSNSVLQRAHIKSLERNILSLEQRISQDMNDIKMNLEIDIQDLHKQTKSNGDTDIFSILNRMDYAIAQIRPKKNRTASLINSVRLQADEFGQMFKNRENHSTIK